MHFCEQVIRIMFCYIAPSSGSTCWYAKDVDVPVKRDDCYQKVVA